MTTFKKVRLPDKKYNLLVKVGGETCGLIEQLNGRWIVKLYVEPKNLNCRWDYARIIRDFTTEAEAKTFCQDLSQFKLYFVSEE